MRKEEQAAHAAARLAESAERVERLAGLRANVAALDRAYSYDAEYKARSHGVHKLSAALFALEEALVGRGGAALGLSLAALKAAAPSDAVVDAALRSLPAPVLAAQRVPTCRELQLRFETVAQQGRIASYVPEGAGLFGQLVGAVVAMLAFHDKGLVPPVDAAAVISRAHYYVAREELVSVRRAAAALALPCGPLSRAPALTPSLPPPLRPRAQAVQELQTLRGLPRTVAADWIEAASHRAAVEQAVSLLRAHVTTLACALA